MNNSLKPLDGMVTPEHDLFQSLLIQLQDDYSQIKRIFDVYQRELSRRPIGLLRRREPAEFTDVIEAMASSGIKLDAYIINELYAHFGGELKPFTIDRMEKLVEFAHNAGVFAEGQRPSYHAQWVALDKTERWFSRGSLDAIKNQVTKSQFGTRYATLARAVYHLLRRELGKKPTGEAFRDAVQASVVVEGKQEEIVAWIEQLIP